MIKSGKMEDDLDGLAQIDIMLENAVEPPFVDDVQNVPLHTRGDFHEAGAWGTLVDAHHAVMLGQRHT
jgi:hypothetical protein